MVLPSKNNLSLILSKHQTLAFFSFCHYFTLTTIFGSYKPNFDNYIFPPVNSDKCRRECPKIPRPVCGSDGKTYTNKCIFKKAQCKAKKKLTIKAQGRCKGKQKLISKVTYLPTMAEKKLDVDS